MKKVSSKNKKGLGGLENKVDFIVNYLQNKVVTKEEHKNQSIKIDNIEESLDGLAKQIKDYHQEIIVFTHRVERMEAWIKKVSAKIGIPYEL